MVQIPILKNEMRAQLSKNMYKIYQKSNLKVIIATRIATSWSIAIATATLLSKIKVTITATNYK